MHNRWKIFTLATPGGSAEAPPGVAPLRSDIYPTYLSRSPVRTMVELGLPSTPETFSVARDLIVLTKLRALKLLVPPVQTVPPKGKPSVLHPLWQNETGRLRWIRRFLGCSWWRDSKHHIYILVSNLPRLEVENLKKDDWTANLGLLNVIISFLFMKGNDDKESPVWELLRRPRVDPGVRHEVFGDVNKLVTEESLRQKYLEYNRGARAAKETSKMQILGFVAEPDPGDLARPLLAPAPIREN
uniref:MAGE domain-containing protein n=1 Tax=Gopherus evgoodei TaxID=1825980 RepID=A0A8C4YIK4_9SAUR